jgi:hypothetical protein
LSGREGNVAAAIREKLMAAGCRQAWIKHDRSHRKVFATTGGCSWGIWTRSRCAAARFR